MQPAEKHFVPVSQTLLPRRVPLYSRGIVDLFPVETRGELERFTFAKCNSYGLVLGTGAGLVSETAGLVLGHYFRKRREFVEMVVQAGAGVGIVLFSVFYKEAVW